ncbi:MAG: UXX-star selenoprotein family 1 [bacterium]
MSRNVVIFGKSTCPYTNKARRVYGKRGFFVEYFDVTGDADALQRMLKYSNGKREVPVIVEGEKVTIGFGGT